MSLHFALKVNGHSIYHAVDITRLDNAGAATLDADVVSRYRVCANAEPRSDKPYGYAAARVWRAEVEHRYGDGALELVRKALNAIAEQCGGVIA